MAYYEVELRGDDTWSALESLDRAAGMPGQFRVPRHAGVWRLITYRSSTDDFEATPLRWLRKDYSRANRRGSRGVYACYDLWLGVYEIRESASWSRLSVSYVYVGDEVHPISRQEAIEWLESK